MTGAEEVTMHEMSDAQLDTVLRSIGDHLDLEEDAEIAHAARRSRRSGPIRAAAVILVVVALTILAIAPVRRTVASWLSIGETELRATSRPPGDLADLPALTSGATPISARAAAATGAPVADIIDGELGRPLRWVEPVEKGVVAMWPEASTTLWVHPVVVDTDVIYDKLVADGSTVARIDDLGDDAFWVEGAHVLVTPSRRVGARTVVLWTVGTLEYRLESDLELERMVEIARDV